MSEPTPPSPPRPRPGARRVTRAPENIPKGPDLSKWTPYLVAGVVVLGVVALVRNPATSRIGVLVGALAGVLVLGWIGIGMRIAVKPGDSLRVLLPVVAVFSCAASFGLVAVTLYPPAPQGAQPLDRAHPSATLALGAPALAIDVLVHGNIARGTTVPADYFLEVRAPDGTPESVDGRLTPATGGPPANIHRLAHAGTGAWTLRLKNAAESVALPLTVEMRAWPWSHGLLFLAFGVLAAVCALMDAWLHRRGVEPAFASAMLVAIVAATYFHWKYSPEDLATDAAAAAVLGLFGGAFGGEILGRVARGVLPG